MWTDSTRDPIFAAVGDGPDGGSAANALGNSIAASNPDLFLFLGDIYETGTAAEWQNYYGQNSMASPPGTLWGQMGHKTQPTLGNHEAANVNVWHDYWHGRPLYTSFRFGNALFFDLATDNASLSVGSAQYNYVRDILTSTTNPPPPCIVAFFHKPALSKSSISSSRLPIWTLLARNGGDLVLNGHVHTMIEYKPLNDQLQLPSAGEPTMVQLINGAGGHNTGSAFTADPRVEWSVGKTPGATYFTLHGARNGGTPTSISWSYKSTNGTTLHSGSRACGSGSSSPPPPTTSISGFSPTSGSAGTSVTITGSGFTGATDVRFNGTSVGSGNFTVNSNTQITATVPSGAATGPISVVAPGGTATSSGSFTVPTSTPGTVLTLAPDADAFIQSSTPSTSFGTATRLETDNSPVKDILMRFDVSGIGTNAVQSVKLRLYCVDSSTSGGTLFKTTTDPPWQESSVTWGSAPVAGTTPYGSLGAVSAGNWYEIDLTSLVTNDGLYNLRMSSASSNGADYTSREGAAGFTPQLVVNLAGGSGSPPPAPSISGFSPTSGAPGTSVTITGSGFTGATDVRFNGTSVGSGNFVVNSATQITATVPSGASAGPISVDAPGGTATSSSSFTVTSPPPAAPSISGFSPTSGPVGTSVTITGSGFTGATDVRFNGTSVGSGNFTVNSNTQITATVPSGAATGPISVVAPGGTATSSGSFTVTSATPGTVLTFGPDADAFIQSSTPSTSFGTATRLETDNSPVKDILMRFVVSGIGTRTVQSVKLRLYCVGSSGVGGTVYRTTTDPLWQESTVTWGTAPTAGTTAYGALGAVSSGTWYEIDLTSLVTHDGTYNLRMSSTSSNGADYTSREGAAGFTPQLVVDVAG